ncbi:GNAT family N-acetyltransferase [Dyella sp. A6]|uniref:GNAT family N-acetyltransferase n=1 Tax=Dyella aluminiiresistens TaxID=3069105 RepID=UPI002E792307|nr:GNAT family N-acetyltransferase [Dyella sp. A6]
MLSYAPLESNRFGLKTLRGTIEGALDCKALAGALIEHRADLAIIRLPARHSHEIHGLYPLGLHPIHADTLVTYHCDLAACASGPTREGRSQIRLAERSDVDGISELIRHAFDNYANHYHSNPVLSPESILAGYEEWALGHLSDPDKVVWIAVQDGRVAGISCSAYDQSRGTCDYVLAGVHPDFSGAGIYTELIRYNQRYFCERGFKTLRMSTQVSNLTSQHVMVRTGFVLAHAFDTYHINAMFLRDPERMDAVRKACEMTSD